MFDEPEYHPEADEAGELWCPLCGAGVHADASRCPACGDYMTPGQPPRRKGPLGWIVVAIVVLVILALLRLGP
jgi:predicted nucleic acid-binding Zn ribbon protein